MPDVVFAAGVNSSPVALMNTFNGMGAVPLTQVTANQLVFTNGPGTLTFIVTGTGFAGSTATGLTAGTITDIEVRFGGVVQATISNLSIAAVAAQTAVLLDNSGVDNSAVENLFLPLGYKYTGNQYADVLLSTSVSTDGALLNFSGNDDFNTGGGNDNVWLGDGNDTGHGGAGKDTLEGGNGNDMLYGDAANDALYGQDGNDTVNGGVGNDHVFGAAGRDRLIGGTGNDTMDGGTGKDTFVFTLGSGVDEIDNFNLADDTIDLPAGVGHSFISVAGGADTVIDFGTAGDQIYLAGVAFANAAQIHII